MAKFLNTRKAVSELEDLIRNADQKLILISPYLKISRDFRELLDFRNKKDKITTIIFGKQELNPDEMKFLQSLRFVILKYNETLHAKCYMNDSKMIITSLNLYEFSMANNKEMEVLIDKNDPSDKDLFEDSVKEIEFIDGTSERFEFGVKSRENGKEERSKSKGIADGNGFCIRTGVSIPFNIEKPLTKEAYKKWNEYGDENYPEKFCHFTGEPSNGETSVKQPILKKNWKKAKELYSL
jgi:phosphatidylserine/phosphatidylglycerophosphate/cardiolipin synthase-like enzyme